MLDHIFKKKKKEKKGHSFFVEVGNFYLYLPETQTHIRRESKPIQHNLPFSLCSYIDACR